MIDNDYKLYTTFIQYYMTVKFTRLSILFQLLNY